MSILGLEYPFKLVKPAFVNSNSLLKGALSQLSRSFARPYFLWNLRNFIEWQGHKYVSQALFQKLQTTAMNFEKLLD